MDTLKGDGGIACDIGSSDRGGAGRRSPRRPGCLASRRSPTSWSSSATISACSTSAPTAAASIGYQTPNIDRIANEGAIFTDYYGQQSCTAGRSAFITGQVPFRTGLSKVGLPGAPQGLQKEDPTIAELLKPQGYATGQFGKNHLGDRDEFLPTAHGFDEFFGNLYHLNAEEEPENEDYPKNPDFKKKYGPRGVIRSTAGGKIEDTGPLTRKRMETIDDEVLAARPTSSAGRRRPTSRSSSGSTPPACTTSRTCGRSTARPSWANTPMA